jgi:galactose mutarotase-like enzyme
VKPATTTPVSRGWLDGVAVLTLTAGDLEASFAPHLGMAGVSLLHRGAELLDRRAGLTAYARQGAVMGIPLLHPWANRLDAHEYALDGHAVRLPPGPPLVHCEEHGLPIHGLLNASPHWNVTPDAVAPELVARLDFGAYPDLLAAFPFPHELTIRARLDPGRLELATVIRPTGEEAVPVSFGFHPYLRLPGSDRATWRLSLPERRHLATDERGIPTGAARREPATSFTLGGRGFDDGYDDLHDGASFSVSGRDRAITVTLATGYPAAQIFSPPGVQFICFEPMTAPTNSLRSGVGLRRVAAGENFTAVFRISVV